MSAMEIEWGEWEEVIEELSLRYEGWTAIVERVGGRPSEAGSNGVSSYIESTLDYVSAELDEGEERLVFTFDGAPALIIEHPTGLALEETEEGEDDVLEIQSAAGTTRVRLRLPLDEEVAEGD